MWSTIAIYHCSVKTISRSDGRSATASAAYRAGVAITDERTEETFDYTRREGVVETAIYVPPKAPPKYKKRSTLWNAAEHAENRKNSVVAREMVLALPHELSDTQRADLAREMAQWLVARYGVAVDLAIHLPSWREGHDKRNHHAHLLFTTREITPEGFGAKTRILDTRPSGPAEIQHMRERWGQMANRALERANEQARIDHRTLEAQGIDRVPQIHKGPKAQAIYEQDKQVSSVIHVDFSGRTINYPKIDKGRSRAQFNAEIIELNKERELAGPLPLEVHIRNLERLIEILIHNITDLESLLPRSLLPEWLRRKIEWAWEQAKSKMEKFMLERAEAERRRKKREYRESIHRQLMQMRENLQRLEVERNRHQALQRLYMRIDAVMAMRPPVPKAQEAQPVRILTIQTFSAELKLKAETARARVPPIYRPRIEIKADSVIWDAEETGITADHARAVRPPDNGGLAEPPEPLTAKFNEAARPEEDKPYKQKVSIGFGLE